jgi:hypothetical protein
MDQLSYFPSLLARITALADAGHGTRQIADRLNAEGFRPAKRTTRFGPDQVLTLIHQHGIRLPAARRGPAPPELGEHEWTVTRLASALGMPTATVYNWIYRGWLTTHRDGDHWIITADQHELERLRERRDRPPGYYTRARWTQPPTGQEGDHP